MRPARPAAILALAAAPLLATLASAGDPIFLGPTSYKKTADSDFDLSAPGRTFALEDFEDGLFNPPGATISVGEVVFPGPTSDSVDADDGVLDDFGTDGHCWRGVENFLLTINFDADLLGGYPTDVGLVWTDGTGKGNVVYLGFGPNGQYLGQTIVLVGDNQDGTADDDVFIGLIHAPGIASFTIINASGPVEVDHIQYRLPVPFRADFLAPTPYLSVTDSPLQVIKPGVDHFVQDLESGSTALFGATITADFLVAPGEFTDSVDGDDGALDDSGSDGWSVAQVKETTLLVEFDAEALGGLPSQFGVVVTDCGTGPRRFRLRGFDALGVTVGFNDQTVVGDDGQGGGAAEDRFIGVTSDVPLSRVEITPLDSNAEFDHFQFDNPSTLGALESVPYLSEDDSPFDLAATPAGFHVVTFEDGSTAANGALIEGGTLLAPGPGSDSVDGDDGAVDGSGALGHALAAGSGETIAITFDTLVLGGLPTQFGVVATDLAPGPHSIVVRGFGPDGDSLGGIGFVVVGDADQDGGTAEDRFLGVTHGGGLSRVEITCATSAFEIDHVQYEVPIPNVLEFLPVGPYLSAADTPFSIERTELVIATFEAGSLASEGAEIDASFLVPPSPFTDSVDGDDGAIDGSGNGGWSIAELKDSIVTVTFDAEALGGLPDHFGVAVTDLGTGPQTLFLRGYDAKGMLLGQRGFVVTGDGVQNGTTAEDRFLGFTSPVGLSRAEIVCATSNVELDHIQYNLTPRIVEVPGDLNGDGLVDSADLGLLLAAWETADPAADLDGNGTVDGADLGLLLALFG